MYAHRCAGSMQLAVVALLAFSAARKFAMAQRLRPSNAVKCDSELQTVMCGLIPWEATAERMVCCTMYAKRQAAITGAIPDAIGTTNVPVSNGSSTGDRQQDEEEGGEPVLLPPVQRPDLGSSSGSSQLDYSAGNCTAFKQAYIPAFDRNQTTNEELNSNYQLVPALSKGTIQRVKATALEKLKTSTNPDFNSINKNWEAWKKVQPQSGFVHPGSYAGPAELAFMQQQLSSQASPQTDALHSLLTGERVPPKIHDPVTLWSPPTDCSPDSYAGPFPMEIALIRYGGLNDPVTGACAANYPPAAPQHICGHIAFVELDSQMSYKQALAFWATGDVQHAHTALRILDAWSATNKVFGPSYDGNGPLEAAWGCASLARAMELLRSHPDWATAFGSEALYLQFVSWINNTLLPVTDAWTAMPFALANWHASIAECWMAFGVLTDDRNRYNRAVGLYDATVREYLRWGRGRYAGNRLIGESTETLRDIYHTLFGLGGLLQTAEMAWQQDDDLFSSSNHVLAAAVEVHARIINAGRNESLLPPGFKLFESMPAPPEGCIWRINLSTQLWNAVNKTTGAFVSELRDGFKYVLGSGYLPTAFEIAYNHFAGRLGMHMPETAALLQQHSVEWYTFHWGLGTLTHAGSAAALWAPGVTKAALCNLPEDNVGSGGSSDGGSSSSGSSGSGNGSSAGKPIGPDPDSWWVGTVVP